MKKRILSYLINFFITISLTTQLHASASNLAYLGKIALKQVTIAGIPNNVYYKWSGAPFLTLHSDKNNFYDLSKTAAGIWYMGQNSTVTWNNIDLTHNGIQILQPTACFSGTNYQTFSFIPYNTDGSLAIISRSPDSYSDYSIIFNYYTLIIAFEKISSKLFHKTIKLRTPEEIGALLATYPHNEGGLNSAGWLPTKTMTPDLQIHLSITVWGLTPANSPAISIDEIVIIGFPTTCWYQNCEEKYTIKGSDLLTLQQKGEIPVIIETIEGSIGGEDRSQSAGVKNPPCPAAN